MKKSSKVFCLLFAMITLFTLSVTAFAGNETNDGNIKIQVATDKGSYGATGVAEITATITNVSGEDINDVIAQVVFDGLAPAGKRKSETSKSIDVLKSGESFSFTYKATLNQDEHKLNFFQKIILWFVRLFNGGYNASNNNIDVVAENVTEIKFGEFTAENVVQVRYEKKDSEVNNFTYEELIKNVDIDDQYDYEEDDVSFDEESGLSYLNNIIVLMFDDDCSEQERAKAINSVNGKVVGGREFSDTLYIEIAETSLMNLYKICTDLSNKYKLDAFVDYEIEFSENASFVVPNDLYNMDEESGSLIWETDDINTVYRNWHHLAVESTGAWAFNEFFNAINIGIVDIGFDTNHEDLDVQVVSKNNKLSNHGTHVAGIIGARCNNVKGVSGLVDNKNLYGYATTGGRYLHSDFFDGLETLVTVYNCKVINFSLGFSQFLKSSDRVYIDTTINMWGKESSKEIGKLLNKGYDFIIVQSAGNGASDHLGVDALQNGLFCSITKENCYDKKISKDKIMDRVMVVANATKIGSYILSSDSNGGNKVDIAAPGSDIYSTLAGVEEKNDNGTIKYKNGQKYGIMSGTSMAAPIVTGVAGLVWSLNEDFTGAEVKEIVVETAEKGGIWVKDNPASLTTGDFPLVNAKLAVEEAIDRISGVAAGIIIDSDTKEPIEGAFLDCWGRYGDIASPGLEKFDLNSNDGFFNSNLIEGTYKYRVKAKGYEEKEVIFTVEKGKTTDVGVIELRKNKVGTLTGVVTCDEVWCREPVSNVLVEVIDNDSDSFEPIATTKTDENGCYNLKLPYGNYSLAFTHALHEYYGTTLTINFEAYEKDVVLTHKLMFIYAGSVLDSLTGECIKNVSVDIINATTNEKIKTPITNYEGKLEEGCWLSPGDYKMVFQHPDYETHIKNIVVDSMMETVRDDVLLTPKESSDEFAGFEGGNGTKEKPYQVATPAQLNAIRNELSAHYIQVADIDMSAWGDWEPIGSVDDSKPFSGTFDGNGYLIKNIKFGCDATQNGEYIYYGLFGYANEAEFLNLNINKSRISINCSKDLKNIRINAGDVVAFANDTSIKNCSTTDSIFDISISSGNSYGYIGGIVGHLSQRGNINNCISNSTFNLDVNCKGWTSSYGSEIYAGGICGEGQVYDGCLLSDSMNYSTVTSESQSNGIVSFCGIANAFYGASEDYETAIINCQNYGDISIYSGDGTLELCGISRYADNIKNCDNYSNFKAVKFGYVYISGIGRGSTINCNNYGNIYIDSACGDRYETCRTMIGGISAGYNSCVNCVNYGTIDAILRTDPGEVGTDYIGGIVGFNAGEISDCNNFGNITVTLRDCNTSYNYNARSMIGGIVAETGCNLKSCTNKGNIIVNKPYLEEIGISTVGGIIGGVSYVSSTNLIENCFNSGTIISTATAGGIAGRTYNYDIIDCYNIGNVEVVASYKYHDKEGNGETDVTSYAGGIIGLAQRGKAVRCSNTGDLKSISNYESFAGEIFAYSDEFYIAD